MQEERMNVKEQLRNGEVDPSTSHLEEAPVKENTEGEQNDTSEEDDQDDSDNKYITENRSEKELTCEMVLFIIFMTCFTSLFCFLNYVPGLDRAVKGLFYLKLQCLPESVVYCIKIIISIVDPIRAFINNGLLLLIDVIRTSKIGQITGECVEAMDWVPE